MTSVDPAISSAAGALLVAVLNECRAQLRARAARRDREIRDAQIRRLDDVTWTAGEDFAGPEENRYDDDPS